MKVTAPASGPTPVPQDRSVAPRETADLVKLQTQEEQRRQTKPWSSGYAEELAEKMNSAAELFNKAVQFKVVEGNRIIIKVVDVTTNEVLREFPPERLLEALLAMERSLGLLIDEKV